ncbi:MAG: methyltransferase domain-containing protein [Methylococcaceae bacterium]|nr:methyltransferase domain-containing protein [Methylococcaceae bacterium]
MTQPIINYHYLDCNRELSYHDDTRSLFQDIYAQMLAAEASIAGKVLNIGCGHGVDPTLNKVEHLLGQIDGVDPFPAVDPHPLIGNRWTCRMEDIPVPQNTYDMAYSYNVVEHVLDEGSFLAKTIDVLKPGAVYWSMSPNARHPFTLAVRLLQAVKLKYLYRKSIAPQANDYPAYYRLCSDVKVLRAIKDRSLPVSQIDFYYVQCVQWDSYFPRKLHFLPHIIDRGIILRNPLMSFIFMFRIEKANDTIKAPNFGSGPYEGE